MTLVYEQPASLRSDRVFFSGMALLYAAIVFDGFAPSYYLRDAALPALSPLVHLHGALFTAWMLLFITQTTLVAARRTDIHRRLGIAGAVLAVVMVVVGLAVFFGKFGFHPDRMFLSVPLAELLAFGSFVAMGIAYRRQTDMHKRLMLLATINVITPAIGRGQASLFHGGPIGLCVVTAILVLIALAYDLISRGRVHPALIYGGMFVALYQPLLLAARLF